ncbi:uncharacterized protein N7511_001652 [Penicillium nucicola]|uniref:uncharacterized protein n=1 Tax=Penicillium nucicola TaxID=1850975 RepID=UPI00254515D6|nr:uncharacterized protein N7511_001652 [Penicillium nucicola]KAJ5776641.1 hypothetical protein N7511_001652 [Penicillium nucicola]
MESILQEELLLLQQPSPQLDKLALSSLFAPASRLLTLQESTRLTYQRAKAFCNAYGVTCNLFVGTLAPFAMKRPDLQPVLQAALEFNVSAQFMLTEVNHGLDARNIQTTATTLPDGDIDLHTPTPKDAKVMPPTTPKGGLPVVAIVMARLIDGGKDCGIRPLLVQINDGTDMCKGVIAKALPQRTGCHPVDHSITSFNHVRLLKSCLLSSPVAAQNHRDDRDEFMSTIYRVAVGTLFITAGVIPGLKLVTFNAARFSQRRLVTGQDRKPMAVIEFRTQCLPILHAIAQYSVLEPFFVSAAMAFRDTSMDPRVRHGIATVFKAVVLGHFEKSVRALGEMCGWQGHFEHNQILQLELEIRGVSTAEGDIRVLAIRTYPKVVICARLTLNKGLASELLIGRYKLPPPKDSNSPIARHEASLLSEGREILQKSAKGAHRSNEFNRDILPLALPLVVAIGHRMAFEAARCCKDIIENMVFQQDLRSFLIYSRYHYIQYINRRRPK